MPAKICIQCGEDCSTKPRTKDEQGRYTCRPCFEKLQQAVAAPPVKMAPPANPAPSAKSAPSKGRAAPPPPADGADGGDDNLMALLLDDAAQNSAKPGISPCPGCGHPLRSDAALCVNCGFNPRTGKALSTREGKVEATPVKPKVIKGSKLAARERDREAAKKAAQMEYIKPLLMLLIGAGGVCVLLGSGDRGAGAALGYMLSFLVTVPIGMVVFFTCCLLWIGFDAPMHLTAMRLAGIYAVADLAYYVVAMVLPIFWIPWLIWVFFYIGLLSSMLDLEMQDAIVIAVLSLIARVVLFFMLVAYLMSVAGG